MLWKAGASDSRTASGAVILGVRGKRNPVVEAAFVLRKQVVIPARHYLTKSIDQTLPRVPQIVEAAVNRAKQSLG